MSQTSAPNCLSRHCCKRTRVKDSGRAKIPYMFTKKLIFLFTYHRVNFVYARSQELFIAKCCNRPLSRLICNFLFFIQSHCSMSRKPPLTLSPFVFTGMKRTRTKRLEWDKGILRENKKSSIRRRTRTCRRSIMADEQWHVRRRVRSGRHPADYFPLYWIWVGFVGGVDRL